MRALYQAARGKSCPLFAVGGMRVRLRFVDMKRDQAMKVPDLSAAKIAQKRTAF